MKPNRILKDNGFTLIELMIVVAIIGILAAIAVPNFLGMQEKAKRKSIMESAAEARSELHGWMEATARNERGVLDVNGDGLITTGEGHVGLDNVPQSWFQAMVLKKGETPKSPWNGAKGLYTFGPVNVLNTGQITLTTINKGMGIRLTALTIKGSTLYQDSVSIE